MKLQFLSKRDSRELSRLIMERLGFEFTPEKKLEVDEKTSVLIGDGFFVLQEDLVFPFILDRRTAQLPEVEVDAGAVPHVLNGASIMRPGIVKVEEGVKRGSVVRVTNGGRILCVGLSMYDREELLSASKGVVVKNLHRRNDRIWKAVSEYVSTARRQSP
ncbi:MAG: PUA domain-containing protein [Nitrososphaeria archaeon]